MGLPRRALAALVGLGMALTSLAGGCAEPGAGPSLVLTLASPDLKTDTNAPMILDFAQEVERRSAGTIRVEPVWDVTPDGTLGWDQTVARAVASDTYDLGLVPARAWDVLGVSSLRALNTPFLIDSDAAMRAVLKADLREQLFTDLPSAGVIGIELWPGQLRHPFGFERPLLGPADYQGQRIRTPTSRTVIALVEALGAVRVEEPRPNPRTQRGLESAYSFVGEHKIVATGNVTFFPKLETLVANDDLRSRLRPDQWQVIVDAATATREKQIESFPRDDEAAEEFCAQGGRIVAAAPVDLAALADAGNEVREELETDPATAATIESIEAVVATVPETEPIIRCPPRSTGSGGAAEDAATALDGIYIAHVRRADMVRAGVTDPDIIRDNTGWFTWTLDGGAWRYRQKAGHYVQDGHQSGTYTHEDDRFTLFWGSDEVITARLDVRRDGSIRFHDLHDNLPELQKATEGFFGVGWLRIADLPD